MAAENAEGKADLARSRSWKKLAERNQVCIGCFVKPFAPDDQLIAEIAEMGDGPAKRRQTQLQECREDLTDATLAKITAHCEAPTTSVNASLLRP